MTENGNDLSVPDVMTVKIIIVVVCYTVLQLGYARDCTMSKVYVIVKGAGGGVVKSVRLMIKGEGVKNLEKVMTSCMKSPIPHKLSAFRTYLYLKGML